MRERRRRKEIVEELKSIVVLFGAGRVGGGLLLWTQSTATGIQSMNLFKFNIGTRAREMEVLNSLDSNIVNWFRVAWSEKAKAAKAKAPFSCKVAVVGGAIPAALPATNNESHGDLNLMNSFSRLWPDAALAKNNDDDNEKRLSRTIARTRIRTNEFCVDSNLIFCVCFPATFFG